jgi:hypothetical protein
VRSECKGAPFPLPAPPCVRTRTRRFLRPHGVVLCATYSALSSRPVQQPRVERAMPAVGTLSKETVSWHGGNAGQAEAGPSTMIAALVSCT